MNIRARQMRREATYWPPSDASDGFGRVVFAAPVECNVRWQDKAELFRDSQGRERTSSAVVYIDLAPQEGGFLALGSHGAPAPRDVDGSREIAAVGFSDNLRGSQTLYKVWLT